MDITSHYLEKRNVTLGDRHTTIQLETYFWHHLDMIIEQEQLSLNLLCHEIHESRCNYSMAQSLRLFIVMYFKEKTKAMQRSHPLGADYKLFEASTDPPSIIQVLNVFSQHAQHVGALYQKN
jgi:predicted DNA-binding ribbon-helix-helix protein